MEDEQIPGSVTLPVFPVGSYGKGGSFEAKGMEASSDLTDVLTRPPQRSPTYHSGRGRKLGRKIPPILLVAHVTSLLNGKVTKEQAFYRTAEATGYMPSTVKHIYYLTLREEKPFFSPGLVEMVDFPPHLGGFTQRLTEGMRNGTIYPPKRVKAWVEERYGKDQVGDVMRLYLAGLEEFSKDLPRRLSGTVLFDARRTMEAWIAKARLIAHGKD